MIFVVEGIDRCGKTTLINKFLSEYDFDKLRYPDYEGIFGKDIQEHLQGTKRVNKNELENYFYYNIVGDFNKLDKYRFHSHNHVIIDRWLYSTIAYGQGTIRKQILNAIEFIRPDAVIFIDKPPLYDIANKKQIESVYDSSLEIQNQARNEFKRIFNSKKSVYSKLVDINHYIMNYHFDDIPLMYSQFKNIIVNHIYSSLQSSLKFN